MRNLLRVSVFCTAAFLFSACNSASETSEASEASLSTVKANKGSVTRVVSASGKIAPREEVMVGSEVSGRVVDVMVDFNSVVEANQILAVIDPETFQNTVTQLEGRLQSALADIRVNEASINRANVNLSQSKIILERQNKLFNQEAVSQAQLEEAQRSVGLAEADLELAEARLESAQAQVSQIKAQLASAQVNLRRTVIRSPINGVVIDRKIDPGQTVQASLSAPELFAIAADLSQVQVEAQIVESDVAGLEEGDPAKFSVDAYPDISVPGVVEQLRLKSQESNNIVTYVAVVAAENNEGLLMPGMTANLEITRDIKRDVMRLPTVAERFRPTPDQITQWQGDDAGSVNLGPNEQIYAGLKRAGISETEIAKVRPALEAASKPMLDIINDAEKSFLHTPMKIRLGEVTKGVLRRQLSPDSFSLYNAQLASERNIREARLWVETADGKMKPISVKLGLSDGAYVEVVSGLSMDDKVVTGISASGPRGGPGGRRS